MAIFHLVTCGTANNNFKLSANDYIYEKFDNQKLKLQRHADLVIPLYLVFTTEKDLSIAEFEKVLKDMSILLKINKYIYYRLSLSFISKFNIIKKSNGNYILKLPFDFLIGNFFIVSMSFSSICMEIINKHEIINDISAILEYIYVDTNERRIYMANLYQHALNIKKMCYESKLYENGLYEYNIIDNDNDKYYDNVFGIFIESNEYKIKKLKIFYNNNNYALEDCELISDSLIYFSFNKNKLSSERTIQTNLNKNENLFVYCDLSDLNIYKYKKEIWKYSNGILQNDTYTYKTNDMITINQLNYNSNIFLTTIPKFPIYLYKTKILSFYCQNITTNDLKYDNLEDIIIQFYDCKINLDTIIPKNVNHIIFENYKEDFVNLPNHITIVWLINSQEQSNLPYSLEKLKLYGKYDFDKMKIPFGCEIEQI
jgi:hypothetical protein